MDWLTRVTVAGVAWVAAGCGGGAPPAQSAPICPDATRIECLTEQVCVYDPARGCKSCRCKAPPYTRPEQVDPTTPRRE